MSILNTCNFLYILRNIRFSHRRRPIFLKMNFFLHSFSSTSSTTSLLTLSLERIIEVIIWEEIIDILICLVQFRVSWWIYKIRSISLPSLHILIMPWRWRKHYCIRHLQTFQQQLHFTLSLVKHNCKSSSPNLYRQSWQLHSIFHNMIWVLVQAQLHFLKLNREIYSFHKCFHERPIDPVLLLQLPLMQRLDHWLNHRV